MAQATICLRHCVQGSGGQEHDRRRVFQNELTAAEIDGEAHLIRRLHESGVETKEIHKVLQANGSRLGDTGKRMVSRRATHRRCTMVKSQEFVALIG